MTTPKILIIDVKNNTQEIRDYNDNELAQNKKDIDDAEIAIAAEAEALAAEEAAKQQAFNDAVAVAVAAVLAAQTPATTAEPTVEE